MNTRLLRPQSGQWVHQRRPPRGYPAGDRRHSHQERRHADEDRQVDRTAKEMQINDEHDYPAGQCSTRHDKQAFGDDLPNDPLRGRAKREADADLRRPPRYRVRTTA